MTEETENKGRRCIFCRKDPDSNIKAVKLEYFIINLPISLEKPPGEFMETLRLLALKDNQYLETDLVRNII
jgi:hypothetical protein